MKELAGDKPMGPGPGEEVGIGEGAKAEPGEAWANIEGDGLILDGGDAKLKDVAGLAV